MLQAGTLDPDTLGHGALQAAIESSLATPDELPWPGALPLCAAKIKLVASAPRGWHRTEEVRTAVFTVMVVAGRLREKDALPPPPSPPPTSHLTRTAVAAAAAAIAAAPLPALPIEMWFLVMGFFLRSW